MMTLLSVACLALGMTVPLTGTVVDSQGKPVAGAKVWLGDTHDDRKGPEVLAATETDEQGHFQLERDPEVTGRGKAWSPTLWAYKGDARIAYQEFKAKLPAADEPVTLRLGPPVKMSLRILSADGKPLVGVKVRVMELKGNVPRPPNPLLDLLTTTSVDDGRATFEGVGREDVFSLDVTTKDQNIQSLPIDFEAPTVTLRPVGRLNVKVVADDPEAVKGWSITVWLHPTEPGYEGSYYAHWARRTTGDDGRASFPPLAKGQVVWRINPPKGSGYLVAAQPDVVIRPGETMEAEISIRRGIPVEGFVREEPGGAPIAGVKLRLTQYTPGSQTINPPVTDENGHFSALAFPGDVHVGFDYPLPKSYYLPPRVLSIPTADTFQVKEGESKTLEIPVPRLRRAATIWGRVEDEAGRPIARISVQGVWTMNEQTDKPSFVLSETDDDGRFVLGHLPPKCQVVVRALAGIDHESEPVTVSSAGDGEPITIKARKSPTFAIAGQVLDDKAKPFQGARIQVENACTKPLPTTRLDRPPGWKRPKRSCSPKTRGRARSLDFAENRSAKDTIRPSRR
jgi:protocatechuate 3,4-dioxygenase beta subunit